MKKLTNTKRKLLFVSIFLLILGVSLLSGIRFSHLKYAMILTYVGLVMVIIGGVSGSLVYYGKIGLLLSIGTIMLFIGIFTSLIFFILTTYGEASIINPYLALGFAFILAGALLIMLFNKYMKRGD